MIFDSGSFVVADEVRINKELIDLVIDLKEKTDDFIKNLDGDTYVSAKKLLNIYLESEEIVLNLLNQMFKTKFYNNVKNKRKMFKVLDAFCKNFIKIDQKLYKGLFWSKYTEYKRTHNSFIEQEKLDILSCISMPMAQLFITLFYNKEKDLFYPTKLSKRSKIFLSDDKLKFLISYYKQIQEDEFIYIQSYFLIVIEIFTDEIMSKKGLSDAILDYVRIIVN